MSIEVLRLRSGEDIITDVVNEVDRDHPGKIEIESPAIVLPMSRDKSGTVQLGLSPWIPYTEDEKMLIPLDWIVTRVSPTDDLASSYCQMFGKIMTPTKELIM